MHKFYIGIDLSTTIVGISILDKDKGIVSIYEKDLGGMRDTTKGYKEIHLKVRDLISEILRDIKDCLGIRELNRRKGLDLKIGVELSNYGNPNITQKFSKLSGILEHAFYKCFWSMADINPYRIMSYGPIECEFKYFNANEWFKRLAANENWGVWDREKRKEYSIQKAMEFVKHGPFTDNEADSLWIAYYWDQCCTTEDSAKAHLEISKLKKRIKTVKTDSKKEELRLKIEEIRKEVLND